MPDSDMTDLERIEAEGRDLQKRHENGERVTLDARFAWMTNAFCGVMREVGALRAGTVTRTEHDELVGRVDRIEDPVIRELRDKVNMLVESKVRAEAAAEVRKEMRGEQKDDNRYRLGLIIAGAGAAGALIAWGLQHIPIKP